MTPAVPGPDSRTLDTPTGEFRQTWITVLECEGDRHRLEQCLPAAAVMNGIAYGAVHAPSEQWGLVLRAAEQYADVTPRFARLVGRAILERYLGGHAAYETPMDRTAEATASEIGRGELDRYFTNLGAELPALSR